MNSESDTAFVTEVLRINDRYTLEVVESFNICPFARGGRTGGRAIREVLLQDNLDVEPSMQLFARLEADERMLEVIQVIYPRIVSTSREFERFNSTLREAWATRHATRAVFVHATFHPDYPCDPRTPDALVYFFRRAPDPTIQLVRHSTVESMRDAHHHGTVLYDPDTFKWPEPGAVRPPSVTERITRDNHAMVVKDGTERIESIYRDIREDRDRSYARVAERVAPESATPCPDAERK